MDRHRGRHRLRWANAVGAMLPDGLLRSLLVDGIIAGLGGVVVFLPQILILFAVHPRRWKNRGYLPRAAFLLDRLMFAAGLTGRSFIPLLSSFACAIPGIMATRTHPGPARPPDHDPGRAADDLFGAPAGVHAADRCLHPARRRSPASFNLQGLVLFALYVFGIVSAMAVAWVMKTLAPRQERACPAAGTAVVPRAPRRATWRSACGNAR